MLGFDDFGPNIGIFSHLDEYLKTYEYKGQGNSLTHHSDFEDVKSFYFKATGMNVTKLHTKPPWVVGTKYSSNTLGHTTTCLWCTNI